MTELKHFCRFRHFIVFFSLILFGFSSISQSLCGDIYVTPFGSSLAAGTETNPTNLSEAITRANTGSVIKLSTGIYTQSLPLFLIDSIKLEGGFDSTTWIKTSLPGATTINRNTLNPEGPSNGKRLVAFYGNGISGFRFQDITITTENGNDFGMSTYGVHLTSCSNYQFVRTQFFTGNGSAGSNGSAGINGSNGTPAGGG
ncbi:hypothetical protein N9544_06285, partial [Flavobacteriales bacterium]|nr:hypothetical protein [Flavobacteriales bacterium]